MESIIKKTLCFLHAHIFQVNKEEYKNDNSLYLGQHGINITV